jgi:hypothetical protein
MVQILSKSLPTSRRQIRFTGRLLMRGIPLRVNLNPSNV